MDIYRYSVPFKRPVNTGIGVLTQREGFILSEIDSDGKQCYGEIPPLPGFSSETLDDVKFCLKKIVNKTIKELKTPELISEFFQENFIQPYSSLVFGIESLLVDMKVITPGEYFNREIKISSYIKSAHLLLDANDAYITGVDVIKMKAGRGSIEDDILLFNKLASNNGVGLIRVDPNRLWNLKEAHLFADSVNKDKIDFIEEPFGNIDYLRGFYESTGISLGADESVGELLKKDELFAGYIDAVIIKPFITGGIFKSINLINDCISREITPIISSVYESGPGFTALLHLAEHCSEYINHGLCTPEYLAKRVYEGDFKYENNLFKRSNERVVVDSLLEKVIL